MAGVAGDDVLNDRQRFRGFFWTDASTEFLAQGLAEIAREFNWTKMAIISDGIQLFSMVCECIKIMQGF